MDIAHLKKPRSMGPKPILPKYNNKINKVMNIPEKIQIGASKCSLSSFIQHNGDVNSGHYTAVVKIGSRWYKCNDSSVHVTELKYELKSSYILFYTF